VNTELLPIHTSDRFDEAVDRAADLLRQGEVVALPTETVYGLAADATNPDAVQAIYRVKGRPITNPLIVHIADSSMLKRCVAEWPEDAERFARSFWPGPLTLVLPKTKEIPDAVTAGLPSVAVRWPAHPLMQAVIRALGRPIAAPSANLANRLSPTFAEHVSAQLTGRIPLIVDGGPANVGIESTVLDLCESPPTVLRPGMIHLESLRSVVPETIPASQSAESSSSDAAKPPKGQKSPGLHHKHYSPTSPMNLMRWADMEDLEQMIRRKDVVPERTCVLCHDQLPDPSRFLRVSVIPHDPEAFARALFAELFVCDRLNPDLIVVETVPSTHTWDGIRNRLERAAMD